MVIFCVTCPYNIEVQCWVVRAAVKKAQPFLVFEALTVWSREKQIDKAQQHSAVRAETDTWKMVQWIRKVARKLHRKLDLSWVLIAVQKLCRRLWCRESRECLPSWGRNIGKLWRCGRAWHSQEMGSGFLWQKWRRRELGRGNCKMNWALHCEDLSYYAFFPADLPLLPAFNQSQPSQFLIPVDSWVL